MKGFAAEVFHRHFPLDHKVRATCGIDDEKLKALGRVLQHTLQRGVAVGFRQALANPDGNARCSLALHELP